MYITRFETSEFRALATFEEDIDLTSGTEKGVWLRADSVATSAICRSSGITG